MALEVRVVAHGGLDGVGWGGSPTRTVAVVAGTTVAEVLTAAGVDRNLVGVSVLGGTIVELDALVGEDCAIDVYPVVGGG